VGFELVRGISSYLEALVMETIVVQVISQSSKRLVEYFLCYFGFQNSKVDKQR
jgi:hypothetical protein